MVYSITSQNIYDAIIANKHKNIKIITDKVQSKGLNSKIEMLVNEGLKVCVNTKFKIQHDKIGIFDNVTSMGSYNWTTSARKSNAEDYIFIKSDELVSLNNARFEFLWAKYNC